MPTLITGKDLLTSLHSAADPKKKELRGRAMKGSSDAAGGGLQSIFLRTLKEKMSAGDPDPAAKSDHVFAVREKKTSARPETGVSEQTASGPDGSADILQGLCGEKDAGLKTAGEAAVTVTNETRPGRLPGMEPPNRAAGLSPFAAGSHHGGFPSRSVKEAHSGETAFGKPAVSRGESQAVTAKTDQAVGVFAGRPASEGVKEDSPAQEHPFRAAVGSAVRAADKMKMDAGADHAIPLKTTYPAHAVVNVEVEDFPLKSKPVLVEARDFRINGSGKHGEPAGGAPQMSNPGEIKAGAVQAELSGHADEKGARTFRDAMVSAGDGVKIHEALKEEVFVKGLRSAGETKTLPGESSSFILASHTLSGEGKETSLRLAGESPARTAPAHQAIFDRIAENSELLLRTGSSRVRLTLSPPQLGTLDVDLRINRDRLKMVLKAENGEVRQILQSNMDQLKSTLQGQGLNVERMDVVVQQQHGKDPGPDQRSPSFGGGGHAGREWRDSRQESQSFREQYSGRHERIFWGEEGISLFA